MSSDCIFCKILKKEIPSTKVYEDESCYGFVDIAPKAPVHCLFIPREHFASAAEVNEAREKAVGHLVKAAAEVARLKGIETSGYRLVFNTNQDAGQIVYHLHLHLLGGEPLGSMA